MEKKTFKVTYINDYGREKTKKVKSYCKELASMRINGINKTLIVVEV